VVTLAGRNGNSAPVRIGKEKHGWNEFCALTRLQKPKDIPHLEEFFIEVEKVVGPWIEAGYLSSENAFYLKRVFTEEDPDEEARNLLAVNAWVSPLFLRVGETGEWSNQLIDLALDRLDSGGNA
jgi:hypothetical protein